MANILIIEDDRTTRTLIKNLLIKEGHSIAEASDGISGREKYIATSFDLVIIDILLPDSDGVTALQELQASTPTPKCLVISGAASEFLNVVEELGADATMEKPIDHESLALTIQSLLH